MPRLSIKMSLNELFIWVAANVVAMTSIFKIIDINNAEYRWLFLLPLSYCILNVLFVRIFSNRVFDSFTIALIHGFYFIRIVLAPLVFAMSGFDFPFENKANATSSIILMIYEMLMVYIVVLVWSIRISKTVSKEIIITNMLYKRCKIILLCIAIALMGLLVLNPNSVLLYRSGLGFFDYEFTGFTSTEIIRQYSGSIVSKFGIVTFRYVFNISRVIIPCIIAMMMKYKQRKERRIVFVTLAAIFIFDFLIMDDTLAYSICYSLITLVFLSRLLDNKKIFNNALFIAAGLVVLFFVARFFLSQAVFEREGTSTNPVEYISGILQSYFSGITNIGASLNMDSSSIFERGKYFIYEILRGVPYASTLFGLDDTSLGVFFNTVNGSVGQIVPLLGSSKFYFGYIFAPVLSCVLVAIGLKANRNLVKYSDPFQAISLITISLYATLGISMYSLEIVCVGFFCIALPIFILGKIIKAAPHNC